MGGKNEKKMKEFNVPCWRTTC